MSDSWPRISAAFETTAEAYTWLAEQTTPDSDPGDSND